MVELTGPLPAALDAAVRALAADAEAADGVAPLSEAALLALADPEVPVTHLLALESGPDGAVPDRGVLGYAGLDRSDPADPALHLVVAPDQRRRGIGTALLARARAHTLAAPSVWAHGALPAARAFAGAQGLSVVRELWVMRRELDGEPPEQPQVRAGLTIRSFVPGSDEQAWLVVNAAAFVDHPEQGRMTLHDLLAREAEPWFDPNGLLLAELDGALLGSVWTKVHPASDLEPERGEIYVLGVDPAARGRGLGRLLAELALARLRDRGLRVAILYTEQENTAAVRLYRGLGFDVTGTDVQYR
jgi:mycothiol synthase